MQRWWRAPGEHLLERTEHPRALVACDKPRVGAPAPLEPGEELAPGIRGLGVPLGADDGLPVAAELMPMATSTAMFSSVVASTA